MKNSMIFFVVLMVYSMDGSMGDICKRIHGETQERIKLCSQIRKAPNLRSTNKRFRHFLQKNDIKADTRDLRALVSRIKDADTASEASEELRKFKRDITFILACIKMYGALPNDIKKTSAQKLQTTQSPIRHMTFDEWRAIPVEKRPRPQFDVEVRDPIIVEAFMHYSDDASIAPVLIVSK